MRGSRRGPLPLTLASVLFLSTASSAASSEWPTAEQALTLQSWHAPTGNLVIDAQDPQVMYRAVQDLGVLKSIDGGRTWASSEFGLPVSAPNVLAMHPLDRSHLMVGFEGHFHAQGGAPYRSTDGGERWEPTVTCEREDGLVNLRQQAGTNRLLFDPSAPNWFYYLVQSQFIACGGFYRSCDEGASYDRNPRCIPDPEPRPFCAQEQPEPLGNIISNDASILEVDTQSGALFGTTSVHPDECALMTSPDKGGYWTWEDVVDTRGTFVAAEKQDVNSLYLGRLLVSGSDPSIRYAAGPVCCHCGDRKAHPTSQLGWRCTTPGSNAQGVLIVRWFGEMSGTVDCEEANDCDGEATQDRVWRPIFDLMSFPWCGSAGGCKVTSISLDRDEPDRLFVSVGSGHVVMLAPQDPANPSITPWNATVLAEGSNVGGELIQDPGRPDGFYAYGSSYLVRYTSEDRWTTWRREVIFEEPSNGVFRTFALASADGSDGPQIVAATTRGVLYADETGSTWGGNTYYPIQASALAVSPSEPDRVYAKFTTNMQIGTTGADSLAPMDSVHYRQYRLCTNLFLGLAVDPDDPSILYAATPAGLWLHPNARVPLDDAESQAISQEWTPLARLSTGLPDEYLWSVVFDPSDPSHETMLVGTRSAGILHSGNRGSTFSEEPLDLPPPGTDIPRDVRSFAFSGAVAFAATGSGVLRRLQPGLPWSLALTGDRIRAVATGVTGVRRVYAAGDQGLYRSTDAGGTWEALPLDPRPPYTAVLETMSRDGRHHLWVPDGRNGLYRVSSTVTAEPGRDTRQVVLTWPEAAPGVAGYLLHYGLDPDHLNGTGAEEGDSPIALGPVTRVTLTGLDLRAAPVYVSLQALAPDGNRRPTGLLTKVDFEYAFSPKVSVQDRGACPPSLALQWSPIPEATGYAIHRGAAGPGGVFDQLALVGPEATTYEDTNVSDGVRYWYFMTTRFGETQTLGGNMASATARSDSDRDGVLNCSDNCPLDWNGGQEDCEGDGLGDVCDPDNDDDGVPNPGDNCQCSWNPDQIDTDLDYVGDSCDNCPYDYNPPLGWPDDPFQYDDSDRDGHGAPCDCAPYDAGAFEPPAEVTQVRFAMGTTTLAWDSLAGSAGSGTVYDIVRGDLSALPFGPELPGACLESGSEDTSTEDAEIPEPGAGFDYLVRGSNVCGKGTYGYRSDGVERTTPACP